VRESQSNRGWWNGACSKGCTGATSLFNASRAGSMLLVVPTGWARISGQSPVEGDASGGMVVAVEVVEVALLA
jgi:hypothetical protein